MSRGVIVVHHERFSVGNSKATFCGRWFTMAKPTTQGELKQIAAAESAPKRHCKRCVALRQKVDPKYIPNDLGGPYDFRSQFLN